MTSCFANSYPIQVSKPKALISDTEHTEPYLVLKNFQPNKHILIQVSTPFILPDPEKDHHRDSYLQQNGYRVETTATPQYYISSIKPTRTDYYYPQFPETVDVKNPKEMFLVQMQPPSENQNEPNYYAKVKKDSKRKKYNPNEKHINYKEYIPKTETTSSTDSVEATQVNQQQQQDTLSTEASDYVNVQAIGPLIQRPTLKPLTSAELNTGEYLPSPLKRAADESDRVEYQMHGFNGPQSYKFGYDTGKG